MNHGLTASLYLSVSWMLTVSYELMTDSAVGSIANGISVVLPSAGLWLTSNVNTIAFVYAFTWIFVLSSVIPSVVVGKNRGFLTQYVVVLTLTLLAFFMPDILLTVAGIDINQVVTNLAVLQHPILAISYLSVPFIVMIVIDWHSKKTKLTQVSVNSV